MTELHGSGESGLAVLCSWISTMPPLQFERALEVLVNHQSWRQSPTMGMFMQIVSCLQPLLLLFMNLRPETN